MRYIIILLFLCNRVCFAESTASARALQHIQKAAYTYPVIKGYVKTAEREFYSYVPMDRKYMGYVGSIAMAAVSGEINTRKLKNFNVLFFGGNLRPDIVYDFRSGATSGLVVINWNF